MFQVHDRTTNEVVTVFAVHKSGPADDQTKFLVHRAGAWRWLWAAQFEPLEVLAERPTLSVRRGLSAPAVA
ncbi:MAG: hypothetical protein M9894_29610 [Planctomycetes bacterium]|nr:hypothetical protein [Planctomycetota bacterium]